MRIWVALLTCCLVLSAFGLKDNSYNEFLQSNRQFEAYLSDAVEQDTAAEVKPKTAVLLEESAQAKAKAKAKASMNEVLDAVTLEKQIAKLVASLAAVRQEFLESLSRIKKQKAAVESIATGSSEAKNKVIQALNEEQKQVKAHYKQTKTSAMTTIKGKQEALRQLKPSSPYAKSSFVRKALRSHSKKNKKNKKNSKLKKSKLYKKYGKKLVGKLAKSTKFQSKVNNARTRAKLARQNMRSLARSLRNRSKREQLRRAQRAKLRADKIKAARAAAKRRRRYLRAKRQRARGKLAKWRRRMRNRKWRNKSRAFWKKKRAQRRREEQRRRRDHRKYLNQQFNNIKTNANQIQTLAATKQKTANEAVVDFKLSLKDSAQGQVTPKLNYMQTKLLNRCTGKIDKAAKLIGKYSGKCDKLIHGSEEHVECKQKLKNYKRAWQQNNAVACKGVPSTAITQACNSLHQTFSTTVQNKFSRCASLVGHDQAMCFWKSGKVKAGYKHMKQTCKRLVRAIGTSGAAQLKSIGRNAKKIVKHLQTRMSRWKKQSIARAKERAKRRRRRKLQRYLRRMRRRAERKRRRAAARARRMKAKRMRELRKRKLHSLDRRDSKKALKRRRRLNALRIRHQIALHFANIRRKRLSEYNIKKSARRRKAKIAKRRRKKILSRLKDLKSKQMRRQQTAN